MLTLKVRLKRKQTRPGKNQPTGLTSELILCSTICVRIATQHNVYMHKSIVCRAMQESHEPWGKPINRPVNYRFPTNKTMMAVLAPTAVWPSYRVCSSWNCYRATYPDITRVYTCKAFRYLLLLYTNPSDLKWPKTIEVPTKQPCSFRKALTLLSNCSSVMSLKRMKWDRYVKPNSERWVAYDRERCPPS